LPKCIEDKLLITVGTPEQNETLFKALDKVLTSAESMRIGRKGKDKGDFTSLSPSPLQIRE
jgi:hypothetical protein